MSAMGKQTRRSAVATLIARTPLAAQFYFAGGQNTPREYSFVWLRNPNRQPVRVGLAFYSSTGATRTTTVVVRPSSHMVIPASGIRRLSGSLGASVPAW
jgi:hypothetical protein